MLKAYRNRWKLVRQIELRELRKATPIEKFRQLAKLFQTRHLFNTRPQTKASYLHSNLFTLRAHLRNVS